MATATASFLGYAYYNNGWVPSTSSESSYYTTASQYGMAICGKNSYWRYGVFKISIPTLTGPSSSRHIYFNTSLCTQTTGNVTFHAVIAKVGRTDSSPGGGREATYPSSADIIKDVQVTCNMSSSGYNRVGFDFACPEITGGTYYVWLWGSSLVYFRYNASDTAQTFVCSVTYTPYTACSAPTALSLNKSLAVPGGSAALSWSGASAGVSTTISGYAVYYSDNQTQWTYLKTVTSQATSGSTSVNASNTRGQTRTFKIITLCTQGSSYNSGYSNASSGIKTNTLPYFSTAPSLSTNYFPSTGGQATLTWEAKDAETSAANLKVLITVEGYDQQTLAGTQKSLTFKVASSGEVQIEIFDGLESSSLVTLNYTVNTPPKINSLTVTPSKIAGNSTTILVSQFNASAAISKSNVSYSWKIKSGNSTQEISTAKSLSNFDISSTVSLGASYIIGLQVYDGYDYSTVSWNTTTFRRPFILGAPTIVGVYNGGTTASPKNITGTKAGQYGSSYLVTIKNPTVGDGYPNISSVEIITNSGTKQVNLLSSAGQSTIEVDGSSVSPGDVDNILVRATSTAGKTSSAQSSIKRAILPSLTGILSMTGPLEDGKIGIRPFTNTSTVSFSTSTGNKDSCENGFNWNIGCSYNNKAALNLTSKISSTPTISGSTVTFTLTAQEVKTIFQNTYFESSDGIFNLNYDTTFSIYVTDNFGQSSNILYYNNARLLYIEAPVMNATTATLGINYIPSTTTYRKALSSSSTNKERMINNGEGIYLTLTAATDYNQDLSGYFVNVAELDAAPSGSYSQYFTTPSSYTISGLYPTVQTDGNSVTLQYTLGNYSTHKFLVFQIWAVDKGGRTSKTCAYSSTYLIACRKSAPQLRIDSATYRTESSASYLDLQLNISDFGDNYNEGKVLSGNYIENFERDITAGGVSYTSKKKMLIEVTYSLQDTFPTNDTYTKVVSKTITSNFHSYNGVFTFTIPESFLNQRLYIKARISIVTGFGTDSLDSTTGISYVTNISSPYVYFTIMPTISYRAHCIGINTNAFDLTNDDEVMKISDTETRGLIRLVGTDKSGNTTQDNEILINLKKGTITGDNIYGAKIVRWTLS